MPTYEYKCNACGHKFERFQSIMAGPIKQCPACKKNKVKRLIGTGGGLIFKGSGFYITDYRSEGYKEKAKADSADGGVKETKPAEAAATTTETKPAAPAKTESTPAAAKTEPKPAPPPQAKSSSSKRKSR
jgi:putative FmdB family regulatory protein